MSLNKLIKNSIILVYFLPLLLKNQKSQCHFFDFLIKKKIILKLIFYVSIIFLVFLSLIFINKHTSIKKPVKIVDNCDFPLQNVY